MKVFRPTIWLVILGCAAGPAFPAADDALEVAVVGQTARSYKRQKLPDGTYKPEYYAIANGGLIPGTTRDASMDKVPFPVMARVTARHLASQNYHPAGKAEEADLLVVVHWGSTLGIENLNYGMAVESNARSMSALNEVSTKLEAMKSGALSSTPETIQNLERERQQAADELESAITTMGMQNRARDDANLDSARILGYLDAINAKRGTLFAELNGMSADLMHEVEERRYYVIVSAYDFRAARDKQKQVLRWVTRISIRAGGNNFDDRLAQMIASAAATFGRKSDLSRRLSRSPRVDLGEIEYLGVAPVIIPGPGDRPGEK